jgi:peptide chain release factor 1
MASNHIKIAVTGSKLSQLYQEAGGHRVQRVPPNERRGRVHTSSVVVAVLDHNVSTDVRLSKVLDDDFRIEWFSGTGKGGQHRNKKQNSCRVIHIPTGMCETRQGRKRESNLSEAKQALLNSLSDQRQAAANQEIAGIRKTQFGSGMRGDKIRTYRLQCDEVVDHRTGKRANGTKVMKGYFDLLWE